MFESDDFDQVLSQFDFPEVATVNKTENVNTTPVNLKTLFKSHLQEEPVDHLKTEPKIASSLISNTANNSVLQSGKPSLECDIVIENVLSQPKENEDLKLTNALPKHNKRKIINSYFNRQSKRKFPGPAGLLYGALEKLKDENVCQIELLSQDIDYTPHRLQRDVFESPIWSRLLTDVQSCKLDIDSINAIKEQALSGNLWRMKAQNVTAIIEAVDRSAVDPLIILRDNTGSIKCTLHRDAWSTFSQYIVSDCCAVILQKPTVLTTGAAFKKHYLNITLNNILAIYSSTIISEDERTLPNGYSLVCNDDFTVIKSEKCSDSIGTLEQSNCHEDLIDDLDSFFSDTF